MTSDELGDRVLSAQLHAAAEYVPICKRLTDVVVTQHARLCELREAITAARVAWLAYETATANLHIVQTQLALVLADHTVSEPAPVASVPASHARGMVLREPVPERDA